MAVTVEVAANDAETRVQYRFDDYVSDWMPIANAEQVRGVGVNGRLHALAANYENTLPSRGITIQFR